MSSVACRVKSWEHSVIFRGLRSRRSNGAGLSLRAENQHFSLKCPLPPSFVLLRSSVGGMNGTLNAKGNGLLVFSENTSVMPRNSILSNVCTLSDPD